MRKLSAYLGMTADSRAICLSATSSRHFCSHCPEQRERRGVGGRGGGGGIKYAYYITPKFCSFTLSLHTTSHLTPSHFTPHLTSLPHTSHHISPHSLTLYTTPTSLPHTLHCTHLPPSHHTHLSNISLQCSNLSLLLHHSLSPPLHPFTLLLLPTSSLPSFPS